jgi:hypothetical protein
MMGSEQTMRRFFGAAILCLCAAFAYAGDVEDVFWESVVKGNAQEEYEIYLKKYPKGRYAGEARRKIEAMQEKARAQQEAKKQKQAKVEAAKRAKEEARRREEEEAQRRRAEREAERQSAERDAERRRVEVEAERQRTEREAERPRSEQKGRIGVVIQPVTKELAESFGLPKSQIPQLQEDDPFYEFFRRFIPNPSGALVSSVEKGSPAEKAGIEAGDVILKFDGKNVISSEDLPRLIGGSKPGSKASVQLLRNKALRDVTVVVGEMQDEARTAQRQQRRGPDGRPQLESVSRFGMTLSEPSAEQRKQLKIAGGVLVEDAQGAAARAGIRRGDIILAVNNQSVKSLEGFVQLMGQFENGRIVALLVRRGANALYIPFRIE